MSDALRPSTWLWGTVCAWAACVFVLALAGLGGRLPTAPAEGAGARPAPLVLVAPRSRLGSLDHYQEVGARPLLMADRRPAPVAAADGGGNDLDATLTSVLITPTLKLAILTDNQGGASRRVRVGDPVPGTSWRLVDLQPRQALLEGPGGQRHLDLRVYDGKSGAAATPSTDAAPTTSPAPSNGSAPAADAKAAPPAPAASSADSTDDASQQQQIEAIRQRIEARRRQLREQRGNQDNR